MRGTIIMASTTPATIAPELSKRAKMLATLRGFAYSIVINFVLPYVIYILLKDYTKASDFLALVISGIPPMLDTIVGVIRKRHIDLMSGLVLLGITVSIIFILFGGSPRLLLIRESYYTFAFGLAYLVSLLFPKPLGFYFARYFATGNAPSRLAWFNNLWQYQSFRHMMYVTTVVWGVGFLLEAIVRTYLVFTLTIPQFLIVSPFIFYGILGAIMGWTFIYSRRKQKQAEARYGDEARMPGADNNTIA